MLFRVFLPLKIKNKRAVIIAERVFCQNLSCYQSLLFTFYINMNNPAIIFFCLISFHLPFCYNYSFWPTPYWVSTANRFKNQNLLPTFILISFYLLYQQSRIQPRGQRTRRNASALAKVLVASHFIFNFHHLLLMKFVYKPPYFKPYAFLHLYHLPSLAFSYQLSA